MHWNLDPATQQLATQFPLPIKSRSPVPQYQGNRLHARNWITNLLPSTHWQSQSSFITSPSAIILEFQNQNYLEGLALTMGWGGMGRTKPDVYKRPLAQIHETLAEASIKISQAQSIGSTWSKLTGFGPTDLEWTCVIASKALHFISRSVNTSQDHPLAIDGAVIRKRVWPHWKAMLPKDSVPKNWNGHSFSAYERYMTAMLTWAWARGWTPLEMEATVFHEYS